MYSTPIMYISVSYTHLDVYKRQAEELAEIADLSTVYISYIENAKRKPSLESLIKISNALEITIDELLYGDVYKRQLYICILKKFV